MLGAQGSVRLSPKTKALGEQGIHFNSVGVCPGQDIDLPN